MKTILPLFIALLFWSTAFAQEDDDNYNSRHVYKEETLFNSLKLRGIFGAFISEYNYIGDDFEVSGGGGGALLFRNFFIGAYGLGVVDESFFEEGIESIEMGHGGLWVGTTFNQHKLLHLYSSVRVGWGALEVDFEDQFFNQSDAFFVVTPEAGVELNIFRFCKLAGTVGYRWIDGINEASTGIEPDALNGLVTTLTLRLGIFGRRR